MKTTIRTMALAAFMANSGLAMAADATNPCKGLEQAQCTAERGCAWKPAETWTRASDNKVRETKARCSFDTKAARQALAKLLPKS
jgi:hypothetical protein